MNDIYVLKSGMTKEQMFRLRLINGFNFAPIIADAIIDLSKDFFQNDDSGVCNGQILYLAISDEEGLGKSILEKTKKVIPRAGTEMDMGKSLTHKRLAFHNYKKKIPTTENARLIDHTPESVDRYIKDGTRIEKLYTAGYNEWDMAFFTGLPIYVVKEYVEIIKSYEKEKKNITDLENQ
ncbi:hypothetical protein MSSIH_2121 [Methanosarcina siciliae HI350]|uniref:Uncharacterized protein n=1 Tax=Methanosarcina siciliae HI350 TaxID=1434119 RepID=A0A0E3LAY1_9EURY|nr:DUF1670 domain-containing protein [Methanosarcina siciliae]AKB32811.1 hypothetical protein MSSIH_2121 [Methanosarcina siciliae HI350]